MSGDSGDSRDGDLRRVSERFLRRRAATVPAPGAIVPFDAAFFGLEEVARYRSASEAQQRATLEGCVRRLLAESWLIEKSGIDFCARMVLLAEGLEEKRTFALIGADEAAHSAWLEPWLAPSDREPDTFNRFIAGLVETGAPQPLAYLLQVVLEGFGIVHYQGMAAGCRDEELARVLQRMARDEGLHHAAGIAAFDARRLDAPGRRFLAEGAFAFLQMMRSGPQGIAAALDHAIGIDGASDAQGVFSELHGEAATAAKLERLRRLMAQPGMEWLVEELDGQGAFAPCSPAESARIYAGMR